MVRDDDPVAAHLDRAARVVGMLHALDDELAFPERAIGLEIGPGVDREELRDHESGDRLAARILAA